VWDGDSIRKIHPAAIGHTVSRTLEGSLSDLPERKDEHAGAVYLVYPSRRHLPHRVTAFRELVLEMLRHRPLPTL
jgi:DNA-binding transcriptional LysR family regulator